MSEIKGNTWNSLAKFFFAYKLWMVFTQVPDNWWYIIHALMVGNEDNWLVKWDIVGIVERSPAAKNMETAQ